MSSVPPALPVFTYGRAPDCLSPPDSAALPVHAVARHELPAWLATLPAGQAAFLCAAGFTADPGSYQLMPGAEGLAGAVLGLADTADRGRSEFMAFGALPSRLPSGSLWRLGEGVSSPTDAVLGFCLGAYRFDTLRGTPAPGAARLVLPDGPGIAASVSAARAVWLVRDLVNTPANHLGPQQLARAAESLLARHGSAALHVNVIAGDSMRSAYPAIAAVAAGSVRPGAVLVMQWRGSAAKEDAVLISICGKGVCFDTGGYDLKGADSMLRMKKDMAGAAVALALAVMIMEADLPCRLELRLACVENAVCGDAMRPLDVLQTRKGLSVEVGNTDAEGRLVLCDLLAEACEQSPNVLLDFATLTGAARTALGPDIAAMFCNNDALSSMFAQAGVDEHDPVWRLPLWDGYNSWLESSVADMNNVSGKAHAGAVVAGLFLQRFVGTGVAWAHFDIYGWNDQTSAGRPAGGEAHGLRAAFGAISRIVHNPGPMFKTDITPIDETLELSLR